MADWAQTLGAIGKGVTLGIQDLERIDEAKFRKAQQQRELAQQKADDELAATIRGIQRAGTTNYAETLKAQNIGAQQADQLAAQTADFGQAGVDATINAANYTSGAPRVTNAPTVARTEADYMRDVGRAYMATGEGRHLGTGMQLVSAARTEQRADTADRKAAERDAAFKQAVSIIDSAEKDPLGYLAANGGKLPNGMTVQAVPTDSGAVMRVLDAKGNVVDSQTLNMGQLKEAAVAKSQTDIMVMMGKLSPEDYIKGYEMNLKRTQVVIEQQKADQQAAYQQGVLKNAEADRLSREKLAGMREANENARHAATLKAQAAKVGPNVDLKEAPDGSGWVAMTKDGKRPLFNIDPTGAMRPIGMTPQAFAAKDAEARKVGATYGTVNDPKRGVIGAYISNDGQEYFETLKEAADYNARAAGKARSASQPARGIVAGPSAEAPVVSRDVARITPQAEELGQRVEALRAQIKAMDDKAPGLKVPAQQRQEFRDARAKLKAELDNARSQYEKAVSATLQD